MNATLAMSPTAAIDPSELVLSFTHNPGYAKYPIRYYDDGIGKLWIFRNTCGIVGIVRAQDEGSAYVIVRDEFDKPIPADELHEAYGAFDKLLESLQERGYENTLELRRKVSRLTPLYFRLISQNEELIQSGGLELIEGYEYQSNATGTGIVAIDLNGESLEALTLELLERYEIEVSVELAD
jgi:hypothetical protein